MLRRGVSGFPFPPLSGGEDAVLIDRQGRAFVVEASYVDFNHLLLFNDIRGVKGPLRRGAPALDTPTRA